MNWENVKQFGLNHGMPFLYCFAARRLGMDPEALIKARVRLVKSGMPEHKVASMSEVEKANLAGLDVVALADATIRAHYQEFEATFMELADRALSGEAPASMYEPDVIANNGIHDLPLSAPNHDAKR